MGISLDELKNTADTARLNGHSNVRTLTPVAAVSDGDEPLQYLTPEGTLRPGREAPLSDDEAKRLFISMLRIRLIDERMVMLQRQGRIGFYIGGTGEEAAIIGSVAALRPSDWLFPCYRENGGYLLRGMPFQRFVDNLFGNANDPALGRQMPNHISWRQANISSVSSPIGTQIPHAVGAAFAAKLQGKDDVMLTFIGEGGTSSNDFHAGMTFAGVWKAPVIILCRNNHWAISVPREKQCAAERIVDKAIGYGVPGVRVDGNDLFAMYAATRDAVARGRRGEGATFIEAVTYRIQGHSTSDDPTVYRKPEVVEPWRAKEPLIRLNKYLTARGQWSQAEEEQLRAKIDEEVKAAIKTSEATPPPSVETMFEDVFSYLPWFLAEQQEEVFASQGGAAAPKGEFPL
jgi:2-oxoisovalerate dehydrogenase E1 component alpha subunit